MRIEVRMLRSDDEANALKLFMQAEHDKAAAFFVAPSVRDRKCYQII